jgi:hypothetical protein
VVEAIVATGKREGGEEAGETRRITCCEYEEAEDDYCPPGDVKIKVKNVIAGGPESLKDKRLCCLPCPRLPRDEELRKAADCIYREVRDFTRVLVSRALA